MKPVSISLWKELHLWRFNCYQFWITLAVPAHHSFVLPMKPTPDFHRTLQTIHGIEHVIHEDVGRNIRRLFSATAGNLFRAARALCEARNPSLAIVTGNYIPHWPYPAANADGPVGAALLLKALHHLGIPGRMATDRYCAPVCRAALDAAKIPTLLDVLSDPDEVDHQANHWHVDGISYVLATERPGRSADGKPRNIHGEDLSTCHVPLDDLIRDKRWTSLAIGDLGNELGMGAVPAECIPPSIPNGRTIACVTPADHVIAAGVSDWGIFALLGAIALLRPGWRGSILRALNEDTYARILEGTMEDIPPIDGPLEVDGLCLEKHTAKIRKIRHIVETGQAPIDRPRPPLQ
jgi:hypothetical protein